MASLVLSKLSVESISSLNPIITCHVVRSSFLLFSFLSLCFLMQWILLYTLYYNFEYPFKSVSCWQPCIDRFQSLSFPMNFSCLMSFFLLSVFACSVVLRLDQASALSPPERAFISWASLEKYFISQSILEGKIMSI